TRGSCGFEPAVGNLEFVGGFDPTRGCRAILGALRRPGRRRRNITLNNRSDRLRDSGTRRSGETRGHAPGAHRGHESWIDSEAVSFEDPSVRGNGRVLADRFDQAVSENDCTAVERWSADGDNLGVTNCNRARELSEGDGESGHHKKQVLENHTRRY